MLSELCGQKIAADSYVGFFINDCGEYLVFVQPRGEDTATLLHSDMDWKPCEVADLALKQLRSRSGPMTVGDILIDAAEASWLTGCLEATAWMREGTAQRG
ncbi:hypothetical protein CDO52_01770 [Nocardiopsis gilva YIM 90087]|uniref:Uncharacterized protein n=2 Tax=Nocardiopsis gilva TaxID=280236 RepID=A0A223S0P3_9ACTN|nr:hypothetical protein [Nocardiopsis gilva]ASU81690.1 hypothetical protein CDO52_01770 [Nocardiopsis gilva YIM 90087]